MITYKVLCLRNGIKCHEKVKVLTREELENQLIYWNVDNLSSLLQRWNQQLESKVTKLKWIYYE
jgi:hypothetical protein